MYTDVRHVSVVMLDWREAVGSYNTVDTIKEGGIDHRIEEKLKVVNNFYRKNPRATSLPYRILQCCLLVDTGERILPNFQPDRSVLDLSSLVLVMYLDFSPLFSS